MTHGNIQALVGTAIVDVEFRQRLLENAGSVIGEFDLTPDEVSAILSIKASTFQGFATQIHTWVASTSSIPVLYM
jgi:hypothetical protein